MVSTILVDDDPDILERLADILEMLEIKVLGIGANGKEAFELYQKHRPDIVLCDVDMPNYDGIYAIKHIREFDSSSKIMMITADLSEETERAFLEYEVNAVIYKPFDTKKIISVINRIYKYN